MYLCAGKRRPSTSVSAVPALRVTTKSILDDSIGEVCDVLVGRKKHPGRVAAIGKVVYVYSVRTMCTVKTDQCVRDLHGDMSLYTQFEVTRYMYM